jgi:aminopeptidase N
MFEDCSHARWALCLLLVGAGCATARPPPPPPPPEAMNLPFGDPARRDREAPVVLDAVTATGTGELITPQALARRLAGVSLVFVGEAHTNADVHQAQRRLIAALVAAGRKVQVGLEMLPYTEQPALDRFNHGEGNEDDLARQAHWYKHWGYDFRFYRDIITLARAHTLPLVAVNTPREVVTAVRKKGFADLTPEEAAHIPKQIDVDNDEHRRLFRAFFGTGDANHGGMSDEAVEGMFRAQCTWDATMAFHAIRALTGTTAPTTPQPPPDPATVMVVLLGSGHVAFGLGAPRQARQWYSGPIATVIPLPIIDDDGKPTKARASYADYLWGLPPEAASPPYPALGVTIAERKEIPHPVVATVGNGSPAAAAGLQPEDRILSIDGTPVADKEGFLLAMAGKLWGDGATLVIERAGKEMTVNAALRRQAR